MTASPKLTKIIFLCFTLLSISTFAKNKNSENCTKLEYSKLKIFEITNLQRGLRDTRGATAAQLVHAKKAYSNLYPELCLQVKCLKKRDNINYEEFKHKVLTSGDMPPAMKSLMAESMREIDLENCSN